MRSVTRARQGQCSGMQREVKGIRACRRLGVRSSRDKKAHPRLGMHSRLSFTLS